MSLSSPRSAEEEICDYCDQLATLIAVEGGDLLCQPDAKDQYIDWRHSTTRLTARTLQKYRPSWPA